MIAKGKVRKSDCTPLSRLYTIAARAASFPYDAESEYTCIIAVYFYKCHR